MSTRVRYRLNCVMCGTPFWVRPYRQKTALFCSALCRNRGNGTLNADKIGDARRFTGTGNGYVKFNHRHIHRIVAEEMLGRRLRKGEIVHHKDGNKRNNSPDNLEVMTQSEHMHIHRADLLRGRNP